MPDLTVSADIDAFMASANDAAARTELGLTALATTTPAAGIATFLATPTSANLRAAVTDESGTGALLFSNGALGTPASGVGTNLTGIPISTGLTGAGTGVLAALAVNANAGGGLIVLADPGADRIPFWDDSAGAYVFLTVGTGLQITGTTIEATGAGGTAVTAASAAAGAGLFWVSGGADRSATATDTVTTANITNANVTNFLPVANDGAAIGASGTAFSDLFLASGAVINFNAGDVTLTHGANTLTLAGGELILPTDGPTSTLSAGFRGVPQNSQSAAYTTVLADAGRHILHPTADNNARTFTIDSNANVAYPIGTSITFINQINTVTIAITSDTLVLAGAGTTGSRTLAANGVATAIKIASTTWIINGTGLT